MKYRSTLFGAVGSAVLVLAISAGAEAAYASPVEPTVGSQSVTSQSCVAQVEAVAASKRISSDAANSLCSGTVTTNESAVQVASVAEAQAYASQEKLNAAETRSFVARAAAGGITYRDWTHTYWGGSLVEKHKGRTYWDGSKAWISSYRGYAGSHTCHSEGGIAVGWAVNPISCTKPGAGSSADAFYRFDASVAFQGSPITLNIGLHYSTSASGASSTWQIGG